MWYINQIKTLVHAQNIDIRLQHIIDSVQNNDQFEYVQQGFYLLISFHKEHF